MCLGVPFKIISVQGEKAVGTVFEIEKEIDVRLLADVSPGDYVLVHAGFAIQKIDAEEAKANVELFKDF
ncbi:MAG: HypC/HybG/HupF family hydrogenase formation chaperone [Bacillota bacterium]